MSDRSYDDYIFLNDIAKYKSEDSVSTIQNWTFKTDKNSQCHQLNKIKASAEFFNFSAYNGVLVGLVSRLSLILS